MRVKFFPTPYRLATVAYIRSDGPTDRRTDDNHDNN